MAQPPDLQDPPAAPARGDFLSGYEYERKYDLKPGTIYHFLKSGRIEGARQSPEGLWRIPQNAPEPARKPRGRQPSLRPKTPRAPKERGTLCWRCCHATGGDRSPCSWVRAFQPVDGWTARACQLPIGEGASRRTTVSYHVMRCPLFQRG